MAWTAPATYSVSEIVTAAKLNTHIRDNLDYLKGNAGLVNLASSLDTTGTLRATGSTSPPTGAGTEIIYVGGTGYLLAYDRSAAGFRPLIMAGTTLEWDVASTPAMILDASRNLGVGTLAPAGRLHVVSAGGGFLFLSANAVDNTLQTLVVAGTVTQSVAFWGYDRNNTSLGTVQVSGNMITPGGTFTFINTDTVTVTVTAGGAITVQRTAGSGGTHQVNMLIMYK